MLTLLAYIYGKVVALRNALYDRGLFDVHDLGVRTISIGNLTTGGTGKTPLVAYIADLLAKRGEKVCILTRGYGRENAKTRVLVSDGLDVVETDPRLTGDEPLELAQKLKGKAIVIADADRVSAAEWAKRKFGATVFVLDDGFQHRKAKRDVDIVCIDATRAFADATMLPAGQLRESLLGLSRASLVVITRADLVDPTELADLRDEISKWNSGIHVFEASTELTQRSKTKTSMFAFCGLGNPESFFEMLRRNGLAIAGTHAFPDHHWYSQDDVKALEKEAQAAGAGVLVTTAKDAVKLKEFEFDLPVEVAEIEITIDDLKGFAGLL